MVERGCRLCDLAMEGAGRGAINQKGKSNAITVLLPPTSRSSLGTLLWQLCLDTGPQLLTVKNVSD